MLYNQPSRVQTNCEVVEAALEVVLELIVVVVTVLVIPDVVPDIVVGVGVGVVNITEGSGVAGPLEAVGELANDEVDVVAV